jgi:cell division protein FtsB
MPFTRELRRRFAQIIGPVLGLGALAYLGYHLFAGERGLNAFWSVEERLVTAEAERRTLATRRQNLEDRVRMLREDSLDRDLLEERLRQMLNLGDPHDIIILYPKPLAPDKPVATK